MKHTDHRDGDPRRVLSAASLQGTRVRSSEGEHLGNIEEIMVDQPSGKVAYAVLSFGGFMGLGDTLFAIPWKAVSLNQEDGKAILNVQPEVLEDAPGFDKDHWPDFADSEWAESIHAHYHAIPYWKERGRAQPARP